VPYSVEFAADKAEPVSNRVWHPTQVITRTPRGHVRLTFAYTNLVPMVSWILQWGPHAKVIEPPEHG